MHAQHDVRRLGDRKLKELHEDVNDEVLGRVIIVVEDDHVPGRFFELRDGRDVPLPFRVLGSPRDSPWSGRHKPSKVSAKSPARAIVLPVARWRYALAPDHVRNPSALHPFGHGTCAGRYEVRRELGRGGMGSRLSLPRYAQRRVGRAEASLPRRLPRPIPKTSGGSSKRRAASRRSTTRSSCVRAISASWPTPRRSWRWTWRRGARCFRGSR